MWSVAWNKRKLTSQISNRFLASSWQSIRLMIQRLWVQTPLGAIFDNFFFVLCNFRSLRYSDRNASDFLIVKNPNVIFIEQNILYIVMDSGFKSKFLFQMDLTFPKKSNTWMRWKKYPMDMLTNHKIPKVIKILCMWVFPLWNTRRRLVPVWYIYRTWPHSS